MCNVLKLECVPMRLGVTSEFPSQLGTVDYWYGGDDTTATRLGVILRDSVESSVVHSLILKPFETFYYNSM